MSSKNEEEKEEEPTVEELQKIEGEVLSNITPKNIIELNYSEKDVHHLDKSKDKWKTYLYEHIQGNLRKRLELMIDSCEYKSFFEALKYEYGYGVEKNLSLALSTYIKSAGANSKNYLSMGRLYDIYKSDNEKFKIEKDKNLEMIYLLKCFTYYPIPFLVHDTNIRFPLNPYSAVIIFLRNNLFKVEDITKKLLLYIDELMKIKEYKKIISQNDCNLIKGFIDGFLGCYNIEEETNSYDILTAMSYDGSYEATYRLVGIYLNKLKKMKEKEKEKEKNKLKEEKIKEKEKEELMIKIFDLFQILEKNKYYCSYASYGFFYTMK